MPLLERTARRRAADLFPSLTLIDDDLGAMALIVRHAAPVRTWSLDSFEDWLSVNGRTLNAPETVARLWGLIQQQRQAERATPPSGDGG